jgi:predicted  nucleic acid-binding Zn-ribbon protein
LQKTYNNLNREFERSQDRANTVSERIDLVEDVAGALFAEWRQEIDQYSSAKLRRLSNQQLKSTQRRYRDLLRTMRLAEQRMQPVLNTIHDQVLFLKHNLNARAVASLREEFGAIENDIVALIKDMEASIAKADEFIEDLAEP